MTHSAARSAAPLDDRSAGLDIFRADALAGLTATPKTLSSKYLYDARGSELFEQITALPEYYPTRTELGLLESHAAAMVAALGDDIALVEFGAGASRKVRLLLDAMAGDCIFVPVDISPEMLTAASDALAQDYLGLTVLPVAADFTQPFTLPQAVLGHPLAGFFPGSTIGNFAPEAAHAFLASVAQVLGPGAALIIGVDLKKDSAVLERAYNDGQGVTAAFNRNLLARMNRELACDFDLDAFVHRAIYNEAEGRIEMHLIAQTAQTVQVAGTPISFTRGETILTEVSYKYTLAEFHALADAAGWQAETHWVDDRRLFSLHLLRVAD